MVTKSQVKYIQSLGHKKFRDEEGVFVAEGPKIVGELLQAPNLRLRELYALKEWNGAPPHVQVTEVAPSELERLSGLSTPNQVLAVFGKPSFPPPDWGAGLCLVLDGIQDPGNLGTIVRIADWFGIGNIFASPDSADVFNPKAIQSTMGSIGRVNVVYGDPEAFLAKHPDLPLYAAVLEGQPLGEVGRVARGALVIGNESKGIRPGVMRLASRPITIPRVGQAESLNAAVATGIILSHMVG